MGKTSSLVELPPSVLEALERGAAIVTGNQRAARSLRQAYDRLQSTRGERTWQPATILAWEAWVAGLWQQLVLDGHETRVLLSRTQERVLWQQIIAADHTSQNALRPVDSLVELASQAWRLAAHSIPAGRLHASGWNSETRAYMRWAEEFERRARSGQWISATSLEAPLARAVSSGHLRVRQILLLGFDEITPARRSLIEALRAAGCRVEELSQPLAAEHLASVAATDETEEIRAAARWARATLHRGAAQRIGIIVPSLEQRRSLIERIFRETLAPELEHIASHAAPPYEFSVGVALDRTPLVSTALDLLRWVIAPLPLLKVSALLVSPHFAAREGELDARAILDAADLRRDSSLLKPEVNLRTMLSIAQRAKRRPTPARLLQALDSLGHAAQRETAAREPRSFAHWANLFRELLRQAGWNEIRDEDSIAFQTRKRWEFALDQLATLDFTGQHVGYGEALDALARIAGETIFAPESRQAPVQILGPLEAAGETFDAAWFLGAGDQAWPVRRSFHPLLPWSLQKELGMPGERTSDDERDRRVAHRISTCAPSVVISYSASSAPAHARLSPVFSALQPSSVPLSSLAPAEEQPSPLALESFTDTTPPAPTPDTVLRGGSDILRLQSSCGFRAFAERRLRSTELRDVLLGMDPMERGTIVHHALEFLWLELKDQHTLGSLSEQQRLEAIDRAIDSAVRRQHPHPAQSWDRAYLQVQRNRLRALLSNWLLVELERERFTVHLSEKQFEDRRIGPLRLTVRIDRVDRTEAGDLLIDYKTGQAKPSDWMSERPDAPQLPLYAVIASELHPERGLTDIAFAKLQAGKDAALEGLKSKTTLKGSRPTRDRRSMEEQLEDWKLVLVRLAEEFHQGDARVDPKQYPNSCRLCAQRLLCRLDPAALELNEERDDTPEID